MEAAKVAQQHAAEDRREAKNAQAAELAAERALKKQKSDPPTAEKSRDILNKSERKASHKAAKNPTKRCRVVAAVDCTDVESFAYIYISIYVPRNLAIIAFVWRSTGHLITQTNETTLISAWGRRRPPTLLPTRPA